MTPRSCLPAFMIALATATLAVGETLPDPLLDSAGAPVASAADWNNRRRGELLELFTREVYGRAPLARPDGMTCTVTATTPGVMGGAATRKSVRLAWTGPGGAGGIDVVLFIPAVHAARVGCFLLICNRGRSNIDPTREQRSAFWPAEDIIARGYAAAAFQVEDVAPDKDDGFRSGVFAAFDPPGRPRAPDAWGTIAAWSWGASRVLDYLVTDADLDPARLAVIGHSRGGKAALWCGANDLRVALTISNDSGSTGAAIARDRAAGAEDIHRINTTFPHWFCANYKHWNGREAELPIDQHELIALCAPRLVCVASASADANAGPPAEFRACVAATPVWRLLGRAGLTATVMPGPGQAAQEGELGYHQREGGHDLSAADWGRYLDFADRHLR